jgi:hypothetical protein
MSAQKKTDEFAERAIAALLTESTRAAAAAKAGISEATLGRWLAEDSAFISAYRAARRRLLDDALLVAQRASKAAVATLLRNLRCGKPSAEIRAAVSLLQHITQGMQLMDLAAEVEELTRRVEAGKK